MSMKTLFKKQYLDTYLWWILIPLALGIIGLSVGTFLDLDISKAIVNQNSPLAIFGEGIAMTIVFFFGSLAASMLCGGLYQTSKTPLRILGFALLAVGIIVMGYLTGKYLVDEYTYLTWFVSSFGGAYKIMATLLGIIIQGVVGIPLFFVFKKKDPERSIRIGLFILLWIALQAGILEIFKRACYRPRFRFLAGFTFDVNGEKTFAPAERIQYFRAWYENWRWFDKSMFADANNPLLYATNSDYIKSWPSGHTGMATIALSLPLLVNAFGVKESTRKWLSPALALIGLAYLLLVAFARIRAGAHYLSDISTSIIIVSFIVIGLWLTVEKMPIRFKNEIDEVK